MLIMMYANICNVFSFIGNLFFSFRNVTAMDIVESAEQAIAANLRQVERIRDQRAAVANRSAKVEHFKMMKEINQKSKAIERETRTLVERIRNGKIHICQL